jgi:cellobiose phosphorylase
VDPCIATTWKGFSATRVFRGAIYDITVRNPSGVSSGVRRLLVDGRETPRGGDPAQRGALLPLFPAGSRHAVELELG